MGLNNLVKGWEHFGNDQPSIDYKSFMDEYRQLTAKFRESHQTSDYEERESLSEKYGIPRATTLKFSRIETMMNTTPGEGSVPVGSISAVDIETMMNKGQYGEAMKIIKDGIDLNKLKNTLGRKDHVADLTKSDLKTSDLMLSAYFSLSRDGDSYVIKCDTEKLQKSLSDPAIMENFSRDLKRLENMERSTRESQLNVESLYHQFESEVVDSVSRSSSYRR